MTITKSAEPTSAQSDRALARSEIEAATKAVERARKELEALSPPACIIDRNDAAGLRRHDAAVIALDDAQAALRAFGTEEERAARHLLLRRDEAHREALRDALDAEERDADETLQLARLAFDELTSESALSLEMIFSRWMNLREAEEIDISTVEVATRSIGSASAGRGKLTKYGKLSFGDVVEQIIEKRVAKVGAATKSLVSSAANDAANAAAAKVK